MTMLVGGMKGRELITGITYGKVVPLKVSTTIPIRNMCRINTLGIKLYKIPIWLPKIGTNRTRL